MKNNLIEKLELNKHQHELLDALYLISQDEWDKAHAIAQKQEGTLYYDRIHALLHRIEGDEWNAGYWYKRCKQVFPDTSIENEWEGLVEEYLEIF